MFKVLSYHHSDPDSCTDEYKRQYYITAARKKCDMVLGEWAFPLAAQGAEYKVNESFTVAVACNFQDKEVKATGDITKNITFFLMKPTALETVCPGWTPQLNDSTPKMLDEIESYFIHGNGAFRSPSSTEPHTVRYTAAIKEIKEVETMNERFGAEASIQFWWRVSVIDVIEYSEFHITKANAIAFIPERRTCSLLAFISFSRRAAHQR